MNNYKLLHLVNFHSIQNIIRKRINTIELPSSDGVFPHVDGIDVHMWMQSISPLVLNLHEVGLYNYWVASSLVLTYKEIPVHKDNAHEFHYSLILPVINTEDTYTCFYECIQEPETSYLPNGLPYDSYHNSSCALVDRVEITTPTLLNIKTPHGVTLGSNLTPRVTIALRLNNV